MISQVIRSLFLVTIVSGTISYFITNNIFDFTKWFAICTLGQFVFFYFYNFYIKYNAQINLEKDNLETLRLINTNNIIINCESCKKVNNVRVYLDKENEFICTHCSSENILNVEFSTILKTNPK